jgi:hypothetical protein
MNQCHFPSQLLQLADRLEVFPLWLVETIYWWRKNDYPIFFIVKGVNIRYIALHNERHLNGS